MDIIELLRFAVRNKASDLHLSAGMPPMIRVHGNVRRLNVDQLSHEKVHEMVQSVMTDAQKKIFDEHQDCDFSFEIDGLSRFRVNAFRQNRGMGAVFRAIPSKILTLDDLKAPKVFGDLALKPRGLVLVTGPTGSGKSTTLAAMINHLNETEYGHILTIEDPIEFVHQAKACLITHKEVGEHVPTFLDAIRSAGRENADVILVGELRGAETMKAALQLASFGILIYATVHTNSAGATIDRYVNVFPAEQQPQIRGLLADSLIGVVAQQLLPRADGKGRVAAHEILIGSSGLAALIREGKTQQVPSYIQSGAGEGMQTMDSTL
ncbi:MAG: hypothetical protein RLZZ592_2682, partial [Pseudomonadota bacterium]